MKVVLFSLFAALAMAAPPARPIVLVEAESFRYTGGWVLDQQFMDQMGSPFLLAHGMGSPVADATTEITVATAGSYRLWVRTRDWVAPWKAEGAPGRFQLLLNGTPAGVTFGTEGANWHWQDGGVVKLKAGNNALALHDLTGFEGRCDAILFASDLSLRPPDEGPALAALRKQNLQLPPAPEAAGEFDLVVVGGGMAGTTTAVAAARNGLKVAFIQDRPILGGNTSSEIRVALGGAINLPPYPAIGTIVAELDPGKAGNAQPAANYDDERKLAVVKAEQNIRLFLNTRATSIEKQGNRITAVIARDVTTGKERRYTAPLFADCTGDGNLGEMAGADSRYGREAQSETGESMAPTVADKLVMGTSVMWYSEDAGKPASFPETPWALPFNDKTMQNATRGDWDWETGQNRHQINDFESIRDHAFRAIYGNWSYQKNHAASKSKYENLRLSWVAYVGGKRESRRLLGDVILQQQDILENRQFPDASVTATWSIDLHVPTAKQSEDFPGAEFRSVASFGKKSPYAIPYRCFYSRNIENLFMAGRNISVTHVALGTVRVMRTTGMMGEVVGLAAAVARRHNTTPRGVYESYLPELKAAMTAGAGKAAHLPVNARVPAGYSLAWSDDFDSPALDKTKWAFRTDSTDGSTQLPGNVAVRDGALNITLARVTASGGQAYTGGGIIARTPTGYGYYEARIRILVGKGWRTAFSLTKPGDANPVAGIEKDSADRLLDYHVYGCEYMPTSVKQYLDGQLVDTLPHQQPAPPEVTFRFSAIIPTAPQPDAVDHSRLPGHVEIDYIRYYRPAK